MAILEFEQIEIDHCMSCGGVWLDSGELDLIMGRDGISSGPDSEFKSVEQALEKTIKCPKCFSKMAKARFSSESPAVIDRCRRGHGIWFGRGELQSIMGHSGAGNRISALLAGIFAKGKTNLKGEPE